MAEAITPSPAHRKMRLSPSGIEWVIHVRRRIGRTIAAVSKPLGYGQDLCPHRNHSQKQGD
jgi:hypothetical protein